MGAKALALLALLSVSAEALEYEALIVREHRVLLRLKGGEHYLACFSRNAVPHYYEECEIVKIRLPMTCVLEAKNDVTLVADCNPKGL